MEKYNDMEIKEPKVYGVHTEKVNKVMNMFERQDRNLGVILSGDKGIGKSLFAKMLSNAAIERGIPMIVVDRYIPGIASYIEDIEQEVMVLFDEFDKTFGEVKSKAGEASPQTNLLSLFDGLSSGKKLFVVTCNELYKLNEYLINRPGRFHYHFRFEYPSANEIREYLTDKLQQEYQKEIDNVISFSNKISMLRFKNGVSFKAKDISMDMFGDDGDKNVYMYDNKGRNNVDITFNPCNAVYDTGKFAHVIPADAIKVEYYFGDSEDEKAMETALKDAGVECLVINRKVSRNIHYNV